jgi:clan AA aspartic protease (TIGR02281 family)
MIATRAGKSVRFTLVLVAVAYSAARGQDPAPAELAPQGVLKNQNLDRSGATWVLFSMEKTVLKDLADARGLYQRFGEAVTRQEDLEMGAQDRKAAIQELRDRNDFLSQRIADVNQQMTAMVAPPGGNNFVNTGREHLAQQNNILVAEQKQLVSILENLQEQDRDHGNEQKPQLMAEVAQSREKYMQAVLDLRRSMDQLTSKYNELAKKSEITAALEALSASSKTKQKLGPSAKIREAIKILEKAEVLVQSDTIDLQRENGVFHVSAYLGKVAAKMVFDTGAGLTTISAKLASRIGFKPKVGDPTVRLKTADGTEVEAKRMFIPTVRVGKFTIPNVDCAVMPAEKGDVDPLLGQSFFRYFKVEFSPEAGKLNLKRIETGGDAGEAKSWADADDKASAKTSAKGKRAVRQPRAPSKAKRSTQGRSPASGSDSQSPIDRELPEPN